VYPNDVAQYTAATKAADWAKIASINGCVVDSWGTKKEFGVLRSYLEGDEVVFAFASGVVSQTGTSNTSDAGANTWLVALTNERFLFLDHAMLTKSVDTQSVRLDRVQAVSASQGLLLGKIMIDLSARVITIDNCQKKDVSIMAEIANKLLKENESKAAVSPAAQPVATLDFAGQITKLAALRDSGILTDEEFTEAKRKIIALI